MPRIHNIDLEGTIQDLKFKGWATDPTEYTEAGYMWYDNVNHVHKFTVGSTPRKEILEFNDWRVQSLTASTTTTNIDLRDGHNIILTLGSDTTINFTNVPEVDHVNHVVLMLVQDATGNRSITGFQLEGVSVTPTYPGGNVPELTGTASSRDDFHCIITDATLTVKLASSDVK
jgi:hypothetical protein